MVWSDRIMVRDPEKRKENEKRGECYSRTTSYDATESNDVRKDVRGPSKGFVTLFFLFVIFTISLMKGEIKHEKKNNRQ